MKYVFNPRNHQINPATEQTVADPTLRDKVVSAELYALVCQGKVSIEDIAAVFAVGKSPEILVKKHDAVKGSPVAKAPANTEKLEVKDETATEGGKSDEAATADSAFTKGDLWKKSTGDLRILATTIGIDTGAADFAPTRKNLVEAILAKAAAAEGKVAEVKAGEVKVAEVAPAAQ